MGFAIETIAKKLSLKESVEKITFRGLGLFPR